MEHTERTTHQDKIEVLIKFAHEDVAKGYIELKEGETIDSYLADLKESLSHLNAAQINEMYSVYSEADEFMKVLDRAEKREQRRRERN